MILAEFPSDFGKRKPVLKSTAVKGLFLALLPIFITLFLNNYIANAPKYAIDDVLGDEIQAIYGFLFMPSYAIGVVCNFIFNPIITTYAKLWLGKTMQDIRDRGYRTLLVLQEDGTGVMDLRGELTPFVYDDDNGIITMNNQTSQMTLYEDGSLVIRDKAGTMYLELMH